MKKPEWNKETSSYQLNGIDFDGHFIEWKLEYDPETYLKESELSGNEWRKGGFVNIYLNGDRVLHKFCRKEERALMLLSTGLHELQWFFELYRLPDIYSWKEQIVGKKVRHGSIPSTIVRYCGDGEVIIRRDDGKDYTPDLYPSLMNTDGTYDTEWGAEDRVHITDKRINWSIEPSKYN